MQFPTAEITNLLSKKLFDDGFQVTKVSPEPDNAKLLFSLTIADWIKENLIENHSDNPFHVLKEEKVGPKIGDELKHDAIIAVVFSLIVILIYLGFRFKFGLRLELLLLYSMMFLLLLECFHYYMELFQC